MIRSLRGSIRGRLSPARQDEGSLPMVMLIMLIGLAMGSVLVPMLLNQVRSTVFVASRENSLAAAQAGIDVVVSRIRAATDGTKGNPTLLPCAPPPRHQSSGAPMTGAVGTPNPATYSATVEYYVVDPVRTPTAPPMLCVTNRGTFDDSSPDPRNARTVPSYALITSTGTDLTPGSKGRSVGRTLTSTYVFKTTNLNVANGQLPIYPVSGSDPAGMCIDGGSSQPSPGTPVFLQACSRTRPPSQQQLFSYRTDLTLQLSTAASTAYPKGLCLHTDTSTGTPVEGNTVVLALCSDLGTPPYSQQWSYNDNGGFQAAQSDSVSTGRLPNLCMDVTEQKIGTRILLKACNRDGLTSNSPTQTWLPTPTVGPGAAAAPQLVNYLQFGRCLDVTSQDVNAAVLIAFSCKQNPKPGQVSWNQTFAYDTTTGWLSTTTNGIRYCLFSPRTEAGLVRLARCDLAAGGPNPSTTAAQLVWRAPGTTAAVPYGERYTFVDSSTDAKRCLSVVDGPGAPGSRAVIGVATCDGSTAEKWNAQPNVGLPSFQNTTEK